MQKKLLKKLNNFNLNYDKFTNSSCDDQNCSQFASILIKFNEKKKNNIEL